MKTVFTFALLLSISSCSMAEGDEDFFSDADEGELTGEGQVCAKTKIPIILMKSGRWFLD